MYLQKGKKIKLRKYGCCRYNDPVITDGVFAAGGPHVDTNLRSAATSRYLPNSIHPLSSDRLMANRFNHYKNKKKLSCNLQEKKKQPIIYLLNFFFPLDNFTQISSIFIIILYLFNFLFQLNLPLNVTSQKIYSKISENFFFAFSLLSISLKFQRHIFTKK